MDLNRFADAIVTGKLARIGKIARGGTTMARRAPAVLSASWRGWRVWVSAGLGIAGGEAAAALRAESASGVRGPRTADLAVRPPYTVTCSEAEVTPAFLRETDKLALTRPGAAKRDAWTLAPYVLSKDEWDEAPDGKALIERGFVFFGDRARRVLHPHHRHAGRVAPVYAIRRRGVSYAQPEDPLVGAVLVPDDALRVGHLDWSKVTTALATELRLTAGTPTVGDDRMVREEQLRRAGAEDAPRARRRGRGELSGGEEEGAEGPGPRGHG